MIIDGKRLISVNDSLLIEGVERLSRALDAKKEEIGKLYEVDLSGANIMLFLLQNGSARVQDLAKHIHVTSGAITYIINGLIKRNIVSVEQSLSDKRQKSVELTRPGKLKAKHMANEYYEHVTNTLKKINKLDKTVIAHTIGNITKQVSKTAK